MSNCTGCYYALESDEPSEVLERCKICLRNPKFPTKRLPTKITIKGVTLTVPQDFYITKDSKIFQDILFKMELTRVIHEYEEKEEYKRKRKPKFPGTEPIVPPPYMPRYPENDVPYWKVGTTNNTSDVTIETDILTQKLEELEKKIHHAVRKKFTEQLKDRVKS